MHTPGDSNQITRDYFDSILLESRYINSVTPDTTLSLYGKTFASPIMMAALSHLNGCWPDGMVEMARGAGAAGAVNWAGMGDKAELKRICMTGAPTVKIIKPYEDDEEVIGRIEHAEANGCLAVGIDIDHAFGADGRGDVVLGLKMQPKTTEQIRRYVRSTSLPFVIKGVLSEHDCLCALEAGAKGMVISHHHGILRYAIAPLMVLPRIRRLVGNDFPLFVDCGVESAYDAYKALALGATAVSVGRAVMKPLSEKGAAGVQEFVEQMASDLMGIMARTGAANLAGIDESVIWKP